MGDPRPEIHCLAARPLTTTGHYSMPALVTLPHAAHLRRQGYHIIGPDPADMAALAQWEIARAFLGPSGDS